MRFRDLTGQVTEVNEAICAARPAVPGDDADASPSGPGGEKGGSGRPYAQEKAAELGRLAGEAARVLGCGDAGIGAAEAVLRAGLLRLGGSMLGEVLWAREPGAQHAVQPGHEAVFAGYRDKSFNTVLGPLVTVTRAWYHCAACGHGLAPRDAELGVAGQSMSPGLAAMNDRAAAAVPFTQAARLLEELAGAGLTAKRVERAAEASGAAVAAAGRERARLTAARKLVPLPPAPLPDKLYAAIDGTGVPVTSRETAGRQGKGGERPGTHPRGQARRLLSPRTSSTTTATRSVTATLPASSPPSSPPARSRNWSKRKG